VLLTWLGHFGLECHQLHASGHMSPKELGDAVNYVGPGSVFPVHFEELELFRRNYGSVTVPGVAGVL
jgi:mRNA degradation ribonuclease J1/J2